MEHIPLGFFAYGSYPSSSGECIEEAVNIINEGGIAQIKTWKALNPTGKIIIDKIVEAIDNAEFVCADLTGMNDNVLFEIGYAIAKGKPLWLILDNSHLPSARKFKELNFLTIVGYKSYTNTHTIVDSFFIDFPNFLEGSQLLESLLRGQEHIGKKNAIFFLKSQVNTNYSQYIFTRADSLKLPLIIDDPAENKIQPLKWYVENIFKSAAVIAQYSSIDRSGFELQNSKCAFLSGLSYGLNSKLIMVAEEPYEVPIDYRGLLKKYHDKQSCISAIDPFLQQLKDEIAVLMFKDTITKRREKNRSNLQKISFGEFIAEHESEFIYDYYVETSHIDTLIKGENNIVIGRKGAGKTATLYYLLHHLNTEKRNHVCLIKPINFEIDGLIALMEKSRDEFEKGYFIESIWKFLIYTEIASSIYSEVKEKEIYVQSEIELSFISYVEKNPTLFLTDFSTRLEEQLNILNNSDLPEVQKDFRHRVSEVLHTNTIKDIRDYISKIFDRNRKIIVLIDNLDKSWRKNEKLNIISKYLLGLLGVTGRIVKEISDSTGKTVSFHLTLFLRSDIFSYLIKNAREPDKIEYTRMRWNDSEIFFRIIEERFVSLNQDEVQSEDLWSKYIVSDVDGSDVKEYITANLFPRPRDIIYFFKSAKDIAVSRGHEKIEGSDIKSAIKDYSTWVFKSVIVENGITINQMENFMYQLMGEPQILNKSTITTYMGLADINNDSDEKISSFINHLVSLSILGREVKENFFEYEYDFDGAPKLKALADKFGSNKYRVHNALAPYLECT